MVSREEVLAVVERKGPIIPNDIRKEIGSDTITIGAMLSELIHSGKVKISNTKMGGSPFYYVESQLDQLQNYSKYLNDKQKKAFDLLRHKQVLREVELEAVIRVALRDIKDFAKGFEVNTPNGKEVFWKWYLTTNAEAETIIKKILNIPDKPIPIPKKEIDKVVEDFEKEVEKEVKEQKQEQKTLVKVEKLDDDFYKQVTSFFSKNKIEIIEQELIRKNSEIDFVIKVPNAFGIQEYYCKARNKKKSSAGDLSTAYIKGLIQRLPIIYLTTGEVAKKATEMLDEEFKGMIIKKL